jgi:uncharacterized protein YjbJ (UPF0337 family)
MTDDRMAGSAKTLGGKVEEGYASATGDLAHEAKGKMRQVEGAAQDLYGQTKDALSDAAQAAQDSAIEARDVVRDIIEERPYTVALVALAVGFCLGRMSSAGGRG